MVRPDYPREVTSPTEPAPSGFVPRLMRSALVGVLVAGCAVGAHLVAGGTVSPAPVAGVALGAGVAAGALARRRLTTGQLFGLLLLGQVALHLLAAQDAPHTLTMVAAHGVATLVSLVALRRAEDLWWCVADAIRDVLAPRGRVAIPRHRRVLPAAAARQAGLRVTRRAGGRAPPCVA